MWGKTINGELKVGLDAYGRNERLGGLIPAFNFYFIFFSFFKHSLIRIKFYIISPPKKENLIIIVI